MVAHERQYTHNAGRQDVGMKTIQHIAFSNTEVAIKQRVDFIFNEFVSTFLFKDIFTYIKAKLYPLRILFICLR